MEHPENNDQQEIGRDPLNANLAEDQEDIVNDTDQDDDLEGDEEEELDDTPELDEEDLDENEISEEDADNVQWEPPKNS
jgi:hypothetical protein